MAAASPACSGGCVTHELAGGKGLTSFALPLSPSSTRCKHSSGRVVGQFEKTVLIVFLLRPGLFRTVAMRGATNFSYNPNKCSTRSRSLLKTAPR